MPEWSLEVRDAIAGANLKPDAAREEAVVEELAQDLTERYEDLLREGVEEAEALRRLRGELREPDSRSESHVGATDGSFARRVSARGHNDGAFPRICTSENLVDGMTGN